jgi:transcriptional regulator of acetoin/glycerol metabolism
VVENSWIRSLSQYGLDPSDKRPPNVIEASALRERQQSLGANLDLARQEMENLYQQIAGSGYVILLTDTQGTVLSSVADPALEADFQKAGLWLGSIWGEDQEGTNGIGTCLSENRAVNIHRDEHFRSRHTSLSCSATPILDPQGNLIAVLDVSSANSADTKASQLHTLALVRMSAALMSNCFFLRTHRDRWVIRFHGRAEYVGLLNEGLIALDDEGRVLAANESALLQLECEARKDIERKPLAEILSIQLDDLHDAASRGSDAIWPTRDLKRGRRFFVRIRSPEQLRSSRSKATVIGRPRAAPEPDTADRMSLDGLAGTDPQMAYNVRCARRVVNHGISLLLNGETGTGKEVFARALHDASDRASKPFVAVNCASIPESLIESELFGYRHGAFTGAKREGMRGKIVQANGGTLFLDEIGDMPAPLQTRLLRVLEEREVAPLGSEATVAVEFSVISATHRDLEALIETGAFREDLYYRLNGLVLTLPPLREREDRRELILDTLAHERHSRTPVEIDEASTRVLANYSWPGNIRQLRNVLRTALALCDDGIIRLADLPKQIVSAGLSVGGTRPDAESGAEPETQSALASAERTALIEALEQQRWNVTGTARALNISRNTLYRKLRKHGISGTGGNAG